jgi:hypothetical protein
VENTENFLDLAGLQHYTAHIKALLADKLNTADLEDLTNAIIAQAILKSIQVTHDSTTVADILDEYLIDLDYSALAFDTSELVFDSNEAEEAAILGKAIIGKMVLGKGEPSESLTDTDLRRSSAILQQYITQKFVDGQVLTAADLNNLDDRILATERATEANATAILNNAQTTAASIEQLSNEITNLAKDVIQAQLVPVDGTIIIKDTENESKSIGVAVAPVEGNALTIVEGGLFVPITGAALYTAGDGIELVQNKISVKLANEAHGLTVVDGAFTINLATKNSDGAMSKEDKALLESLSGSFGEVQDTIEVLTNSTTWGDFAT